MNLDWTNLRELLREASAKPEAVTGEQPVFPGCATIISRRGEILFHEAFGSRSIEPERTPMRKDFVFDVASLTKALVTTTLAMMLVDEGRLSIDKKLTHQLQSFGLAGKERITVRHLLNHTSGYPAWVPFYKSLLELDRGERAGILTSRGAVEWVLGEIFRMPLETPPGQRTAYSDVGFILLGHVLEVVSAGMPLDRLAQRLLFRPLGLHSTAFIDLSKLKRRGLQAVSEVIVPTARCPWRERILCGEVHDDNCYAMGGISGHAGVFSTAEELHVIARELLECYHGRGRLISKEIVRRFWRRDGLDSKSTWALGWDTPSAEGSSAGHHFSAAAVGHLGYTGGSIWIEPEKEIVVILLTNRIHPSPENNRIKEFRPKFHDAVMELIGK